MFHSSVANPPQIYFYTQSFYSISPLLNSPRTQTNQLHYFKHVRLSNFTTLSVQAMSNGKLYATLDPCSLIIHGNIFLWCTGKMSYSIIQFMHPSTYYNMWFKFQKNLSDSVKMGLQFGQLVYPEQCLLHDNGATIPNTRHKLIWWLITGLYVVISFWWWLLKT